LNDAWAPAGPETRHRVQSPHRWHPARHRASHDWRRPSAVLRAPCGSRSSATSSTSEIAVFASISRRARPAWL